MASFSCYFRWPLSRRLILLTCTLVIQLCKYRIMVECLTQRRHSSRSTPQITLQRSFIVSIITTTFVGFSFLIYRPISIISTIRCSNICLSQYSLIKQSSTLQTCCVYFRFTFAFIDTDTVFLSLVSCSCISVPLLINAFSSFKLSIYSVLHTSFSSHF